MERWTGNQCYFKAVSLYEQLLLKARCLIANSFFFLFPQENAPDSSADFHANVHSLQALIREATLILQEPLEATAGPLRTYRKRLQVGPTELSIIRYSFYIL